MLLEGGGSAAPGDLRKLVEKDNVLARASGAARAKLYKELKGRYLLDPANPLFRAFLNEWSLAISEEEKALLAYTLLSLNDRTVMVISTEWLVDRLRRADSELRVGDLENFLLFGCKIQHPEISTWTPSTLRRVAQHYLASVRDFGLAKGGIKKFGVRPALYAAPIRLLLRALKLAKVPDHRIIAHDCFKILGITPGEVVGVLEELNRQGSLSFRQQADIIEISL